MCSIGRSAPKLPQVLQLVWRPHNSSWLVSLSYIYCSSLTTLCQSSPINDRYISLKDWYSDKSLPTWIVCEEQASGFLAEKSSSFAPRRFLQRLPSLWQAAIGWGSRGEGPPPPSDSQAGPCLAASWQTSQSHPARHPEQRPLCVQVAGLSAGC